MPELAPNLDGWDPLADGAEGLDSFSAFREAATKSAIVNVLRSYTGFYDVFAEMIQNALDAVERRFRSGESGDYIPRIWIRIDMPNRSIRVTDNGVGMLESDFKYCLRPNVTFKSRGEDRGNKGVGATFLAYGFSFFRLHSRAMGGPSLAATLRQGRHWAQDRGGSIPRPVFQRDDFDIPEIGADSGTRVEVHIGEHVDERPRDLGWIGARTADQWIDVLRIKTPLGGVYLSTPPFQPQVEVTVIDQNGSTSMARVAEASYYFPHEIPDLKVASLSDIDAARRNVSGDWTAHLRQCPPELKRLDCIYDIWSDENIVDDESIFYSALTEEQRVLVRKHRVHVYAAFLRSAKLWGEFNDEVLRLRKGQKLMHGGLQMASDFMVQGEPSVIPLTSAIGYQANSHVIVHFFDGNPDMGRKTFQPELQKLADSLAVRAVNQMKRYLAHLKADTGAQVLAPSRELWDWKIRQQEYRNTNPLSYFTHGRELALASEPQQEQDVIALFHELVGLGVIRGLRFLATSQSDRYDSLLVTNYPEAAEFQFSRSANKLGVARSQIGTGDSDPKVLEYKYDLDYLMEDLRKERKFEGQIDLVVCWKTGDSYKQSYYLEPFLVGDEGDTRTFFGATHRAARDGATSPAFEVVVLEDLLRFMVDPSEEEQRQRERYRET